MSTLPERERIVSELATLPAGTVVVERIGGRDQPYLQWREGGKVRSRYLKAIERQRRLRPCSIVDRRFPRGSRSPMRRLPHQWVNPVCVTSGSRPRCASAGCYAIALHVWLD